MVPPAEGTQGDAASASASRHGNRRTAAPCVVCLLIRALEEEQERGRGKGIHSMQSMTGYGRSEVRHAHLALTVEARSVNHRYLDIALRYPRIYAPLEARMKQRVSAYFTRGRIDITLAPQESPDTRRALLLDHTLAQHYYDALQRLQESLGLPGTIDLSLIASLRDVFRVEEASADMENDWHIIAQGLDAALQALQTMRRQEGEVLSRDFRLRLQANGAAEPESFVNAYRRWWSSINSV